MPIVARGRRRARATAAAALLVGLGFGSVTPAYGKAKSDWELEAALGAQRAEQARRIYVDQGKLAPLGPEDRNRLATICAQSTALCTSWLEEWAANGRLKSSPFETSPPKKLADGIAAAMAAGGLTRLVSQMNELTNSVLALRALGTAQPLAGLDAAIKDLEEGLYLVWVSSKQPENFFWYPFGLARSSGHKTLFDPYRGQLHSSTSKDIAAATEQALKRFGDRGHWSFQVLQVDVDLDLEEVERVITEIAAEIYKSGETQELAKAAIGKPLRNKTLGADLVRVAGGIRIVHNGNVVLERKDGTTVYQVLATLQQVFGANVEVPPENDNVYDKDHQEALQRMLVEGWDNAGDLSATLRLVAQGVITTGQKMHTDACRARGIELWTINRLDPDFKAGEDNWRIDIEVNDKEVVVRHTTSLHEEDTEWTGEQKVWRPYKLRFIFSFTYVRGTFSAQGKTAKVLASPLDFKLEKAKAARQ